MDAFGSSIELLRPAPAADGLQPGSTGARLDKPAKTRSRTGCLTCRRRKHKCGEERLGPLLRPSCERCLAAGLDCLWPTVEQLPKGRKRRTRQPSANLTVGHDALPALPIASLSGVQDTTQPRPQIYPPLQLSDLAAYAPSLLHVTAAGPACNTSARFGTDTTGPWSSFNAVAGPSSYTSIPPSDEFFLGGRPAQQVLSTVGSTHDWSLSLTDDATFAAAGMTLDSCGMGSGGPEAWLEDISSPIFDFNDGRTLPIGLPPEQPTFGSASDVVAELVTSTSEGRQAADNWYMSPPRFIAPTPTLELLYRNPEERALIQFFLVQIPIIFIGRPQAPRGTLIPPPALLPDRAPDLRLLPRFDMLLPYFDIPHFLSLPRGSSMATDALALAVMSMSAIHLAHLHWTNGLEALRTGDYASAARAAESEKRYRAIGRSFVSTSLALVRSSIDLVASTADLARLGLRGPSAASDGVEGTDEMARLLVACSFAVLTDCISGGNAHLTALTMAKEVLASQGGARWMLASMAASITSSRASPLAATRRRRLRLFRSVLEELVSWELVTTLSTSTAPNLFAKTHILEAQHGEGSDDVTQPDLDALENWFFDFAPPSGSRDTAGVDWETLETTWGASRTSAFIFARVNTICAAARAAPSGIIDATVAASASAVLIEIAVRKADLLRAYPELQQSPFPAHDRPIATATGAEEYERHLKYGKLGACSDGPSSAESADSFFEPRLAKRLEFGDLLWCQTFEILLRVDVQGEPSDSPVIRGLALRVLELVIESHARKHVQVGYGWPVIVAGAMLDDKPSRQKVRVAMGYFRSYCLFEVMKASAVLDDLWAARDAGDHTTTWRDLAARDGGFAFA